MIFLKSNRYHIHILCLERRSYELRAPRTWTVRVVLHQPTAHCPPRPDGSTAQEFPTIPISQTRGPELWNPRATGEGAWIAPSLIGWASTNLNLVLVVICGNTRLSGRLKCEQMLNILFRIYQSLASGNYGLYLCCCIEQFVQKKNN